MKQYTRGILTGLIMMTTILMLMGTSQAKDDSLNSIMSELDNYVQDQLDKDKAAGRFQLTIVVEIFKISLIKIKLREDFNYNRFK